MIINQPNACTHLEIWAPRYSDAYTATNERCALLAKYKVDMSSPVIIVDFTRAPHLKGQRFAIQRKDVQRCPVDSNGKIPCYAVPISAFEHWDSGREVVELVNSFGW